MLAAYETWELRSLSQSKSLGCTYSGEAMNLSLSHEGARAMCAESALHSSIWAAARTAFETPSGFGMGLTLMSYHDCGRTESFLGGSTRSALHKSSQLFLNSDNCQRWNGPLHEATCPPLHRTRPAATTACECALSPFVSLCPLRSMCTTAGRNSSATGAPKARTPTGCPGGAVITSVEPGVIGTSHGDTGGGSGGAAGRTGREEAEADSEVASGGGASAGGGGIAGAAFVTLLFQLRFATIMAPPTVGPWPSGSQCPSTHWPGSDGKGGGGGGAGRRLSSGASVPLASASSVMPARTEAPNSTQAL